MLALFRNRRRHQLLILLLLEACNEAPAAVHQVAALQDQLDPPTPSTIRSVYNLTGRGVRIAVVDTGVDLTHPDLKDAVVAQHCFVTVGCQPLPASEGTNAQDTNGHGTNVAGVIASRGMVGPAGYATEVQMVAVKAGSATTDWVAALNWINTNLATLKVQIVVLGVGSDVLFGTDCDMAQATSATAIRTLVDAGVTVFAASGDKGSPTQLAAPACNTGAIAVGASYGSALGPEPSGLSYSIQFGSTFANCKDQTTAADQITCFTNSGPRLDLIAPGASILTDALGGGTATVSSTTEASAAAAGIAALMLQCNPSLKPAEIKAALTSTGVAQVDAKNKMSYPVVRALDAVRAVCPSLAADGGVTHAPDAGAATTPSKPTKTTDTTDADSRLGARYVAGVRAPALLIAGARADTSSDAAVSSDENAGNGTDPGNKDGASGAGTPSTKNASHGGCASAELRGYDRSGNLLGFAALLGGALVISRGKRRAKRLQLTAATQVR